MDEFLTIGRRVLSSQPFSMLLNAELVALSEGFAELKILLKPEFTQQHGFVHGGVISYSADNALTFAGGTVLGNNVVTSEYKINYVRPATGDFLRARATVIHTGSTQAVCRCDVFVSVNGTECLCATAQGTITKLHIPQAVTPTE